jgi:metal-responsive CopG/Arc/MetJ family transcriptional regulator
MKVIRVMVEKRLLLAVDRAARQTGQSRSALIRDALREHIRILETRAWEERDRRGYARKPQEQALAWESEAVWLEEQPKRSRGLFQTS